jgi:hypothetical protein
MPGGVEGFWAWKSSAIVPVIISIGQLQKALQWCGEESWIGGHVLRRAEGVPTSLTPIGRPRTLTRSTLQEGGGKRGNHNALALQRQDVPKVACQQPAELMAEMPHLRQPPASAFALLA